MIVLDFRRRWKLIIAILLAGILIIAAVVVGPFAYELLGNPFNDQRFDRTVWLANAHNPDMHNPRGPMADDIMSRYLHKGITKTEVRILLGAPNNSQYDDEQGNKDSYRLGNWGFMSIDGDFLIVHYNAQGRVASTEIYTH